MKILIVDRDVVTSNQIKLQLAPLGHQVEIIADREGNFDAIVAQGWDVIFLDPSPLTSIKSAVMGMRRSARRNVYITLLSDSMTQQDAIESSFNSFVKKPVNAEQILSVLDNASQLGSLQRHLANSEEDYPSAGGVIAKSAFNQLFLSCLDRADRYGEGASIIFISFANFTSISASDGAYDAEMISAKLARHLVQMRRQSDIIAQIRKNEYALLLLRPSTESEPTDAEHRFVESLAKCTDLPTNPIMDVEIRISLMSLPSGKITADHTVVLRQG